MTSLGQFGRSLLLAGMALTVPVAVAIAASGCAAAVVGAGPRLAGTPGLTQFQATGHLRSAPDTVVDFDGAGVEVVGRALLSGDDGAPTWFLHGRGRIGFDADGDVYASDGLDVGYGYRGRKCCFAGASIGAGYGGLETNAITVPLRFHLVGPFPDDDHGVPLVDLTFGPVLRVAHDLPDGAPAPGALDNFSAWLQVGTTAISRITSDAGVVFGLRWEREDGADIAMFTFGASVSPGRGEQ